MTSTTPDRISVRTFSRTFEKMCNFIAVAKTGDPSATVRGLVTLCLFELPDEQFDTTEQFRLNIETLFGLVIPEDQLEAALNELERQNLVIRPGNTNYRLASDAMSVLKQAIDDSHALEDRIKSTWFEHLEVSYPDLPINDAWEVLRAYLSRTFRRHGIQAAALLDPTVDTPAEHEASLTSILCDVIEEHGFGEPQLRSDAEVAISEFMAALGTDPDRIRYITQLADGAFNFYTLEVPADLSKQLCQQLNKLTLFLDTNFLFGILDLHNNTQVQVSHDLLRAINKHGLPFKLRFHEATQKEMASTILHYGSILRSCTWTRSLSRAATNSNNLSGIEQKFHEHNACSLIDVDEFLRKYEHFDTILSEKGIKLFRPHMERSASQNDLFHEYRAFLENNGRGDKPYETVMHDAKVLEEARNLRTSAKSSLEAGALLISCDYLLYRFDWETSRRNGRRACVLLPNIFWQILRPFVPADQDFEKAFAETFALPEFRAIGSGGNRACSKMLQILATYRDVPEPTAIKLLANGLLLDRLRSEYNDANFEKQVEAAFVEENRNLLEEKVALENELKRQKSRAEEESRKRQEDQDVLYGKDKELNEVTQLAEKHLNVASRTIKQHEIAAAEAMQRAKLAEKTATDAQRKAESEAKAKGKAERRAFHMSVIAGIAIGIAMVVLFEFLAHTLPWNWFITHKNAVPLHIESSAILMLTSVGFLVKAWRYYCLGVAGLAFSVTLVQTLGN